MRFKVPSYWLGNLLEFLILHKIDNIQEVQWVQVHQVDQLFLVFQVLLFRLVNQVLQYQEALLNLLDLVVQVVPCCQFLVFLDLLCNPCRPLVQLALGFQACLEVLGILFVQFLLVFQGHQLVLLVLEVLMDLCNLFLAFQEVLVTQQLILTVDL